MKILIFLLSFLSYSCFHEKDKQGSQSTPVPGPFRPNPPSTESTTATASSTATSTATATNTHTNTQTNTATGTFTSTATKIDTDIDFNDPDLNNPHRRTFVLKKDKTWLRELTPDERAGLKSPETIAAVVDSVRLRSLAAQTPHLATPDIRLERTQAEEVWDKYKDQWLKTKEIIRRLPVQCRTDFATEFTGLSASLDQVVTRATTATMLDSVKAIREPYLRMQNLLSACRTNTFLKQVSDITLLGNLQNANKILLHMFGDIFGEGSGFEGLAGTEHLQQRHYLFVALQESLKTQTFIKDATQADPGAGFITDSNFIAPYPDLSQASLDDLVTHSDEMIQITKAMGGSDLNLFERKFKESLDKLRSKNDYFYMQGGWTMHAINYEVRRDIGGNFSFRVFNSGAGINYHFGSDIPGRSLVFPYVEKRNVTKESLLTKGFLATLFGLKQYSAEGNAASPANLYLAVARLLDGDLITRAPSFEDFLDPQLSGTCAYYSVPYYFQSRDNFDKIFPDFLESNIQLKYLDDFFRIQGTALGQFFTSYNMASKSLIFFSESIANASMRGKKHVDAGFERAAAEKLAHYYQILKIAFDKLKETEKTSLAAKVDALVSRANPGFRKILYTVPERNVLPKRLTSSSVLSRENWEPTRVSIKQDLGESIRQILLDIDKHSHDGVEQKAILQTLLSMILKLPLDPEDLSFWDFSQEDLGDLLFSLRRLDELYLWSLLDHVAYSSRDQRGINPIEYLAQVKLLTITDILLQNLKKKQAENRPADPVKLKEYEIKKKALEDLNSLHLASIDPYIKGEKIHFAIHDAAWNEQVGKIKKYWQDKPVYDFFELGKMGHECRTFFLSKDDFTLHKNSGQTLCELNDVPTPFSSKDLQSLLDFAKDKLPRSAKTFMMFDQARTKIEFLDRNTSSGYFWFEKADWQKYAWNQIFNDIWPVSNPLYSGTNIIDLEERLIKKLNWNIGDPLSLALSLLKEGPLSISLLGSNYFHLRSIAFISEYFNSNNFEKSAAELLLKNYRFNSETNYFGVAKNMLASIKDRDGLDLSLNENQFKRPIATDYDCWHNFQYGWKCSWHLFKVHLNPPSTDPNAKKKLKPKTLDEAFAFNEPSLSSLAEPLANGYDRIRRSTSEMVVTNFAKENPQENFDTLRQLATIGQSQESQIQQAFGFFSENSYLLRDTQWRSVYKKLEFDPGLIAIEAAKNPILSKTLGKFAREQYESAKADNDYLHAVYFLRLNQYYKEHMQALHKADPRIPFNANDFEDSRARLIEAIEKENPNTAVNNVFFRDLIRTYLLDTKIENDDDLAWLYIAHIYRKLHPQKTQYYEQDLENEIDGILLRKKDLIADYLKIHKGALPKIVKFFRRDFDDAGSVWMIVGNLCSLPGSATVVPVTLNLSNADLIINGGELKNLATEIRNDKYFLDFVGLDFETPILIDSYYEFHATNEGVKRHYRVREEYGKIVIQRQWGKRWYQHIKDEVVKEHTIDRETGLDPQTELSLFPGFSHWVSVKDSAPFSGPKEEDAYEIPLSGWDNDSPEVLVFRAKQSHLSMLVRLKTSIMGWWDKEEVEKVIKLSANGKTLSNYEYHPVRQVLGVSSPYLKLFNDFEHARYTLAWRAAGKPDLIEFPRLNLEFKYDSSTNKLSSDEYGVLQSSFVPDLLHTRNALLFKNNKGSFNLIVSQFELKAENSIDLSTLELEKDVGNYHVSSKNFYVYSYNENTQNVRAFSVDSKLYLAYLYLINQKYEKALSLLRELNSSTVSFSRKEDKEPGSPLNNFSKRIQDTISWIITAKNKDSDPRASALRLRAMVLVLRDIQIFRSDFKVADLNENNEVTKTYQDFINKRSRIENSWLSEDEEIWLYYHNLLLVKKVDLFSGVASYIPFKDDGAFKLRYNNLVSGSFESVSRAQESMNKASTSIRMSYSFEQTINYPKTKQGFVSVLKGGQLQAFLNEIYDIVKRWNGTIDNDIRTLFSNMGYTGFLNEPRKEFLALLNAIQIADNKRFEKDTDFAKFFIKIIKANEVGELPSWDAIKAMMQETSTFYGDYARLSDAERSAFWWKQQRFWRVFDSGDSSDEGSIYFDNMPSITKEEFTKLAPLQFQKESNPHPQDKIDFSKITISSVQDYILEKPIISEEELKDLLVETPLVLSQKTQIEEANETLKKVWGLAAGAEKNNKYTQEYIKKLAENLDKKVLAKKVSPVYAMHASGSWTYRRNELKALGTTVQTLIDQSVAEITGEHGLANKEPSTWVGKARRSLQEFAGLRSKTNLDQLLKMFAAEDVKALFDSNSALENDDVKLLLSKIKTFLVLATYKQKVDALVVLIDKILVDSRKPEWANPLIAQSELQNFKDSALQIRSYNLNEHPDYLAFEYFMEFLIRSEQKLALDRLNIKKRIAANPQAKGALYELIMGSGKTTVLLPLISSLNAGDDALSVVVFPESLLPSMSHQIADQMQSVFGRTIEVMDIKRSHKYTAEMVQDLLERLQKALKNHTLVVMSNSSIQSLLLLFVEAIKDPKKNDQLFVFKELFSFLKKYAYLTIDEVDSVLDIMKAHRFSIGKPVAFNKDAYFATLGLYHLIVKDTEIKDSLDLPFLKEKGAGSTIFNEGYYESKIKNLLIKKLVSEGEDTANLLFFHQATEDLKKFYKELDKTELYHFLSSSDAQFNRDYLKEIEDPVLRGFLATLYTQIHMVLPLTWGRLYKVHYGLYPLEKCVPGKFCQEFIAIPYHSGTPLPDSRFGSDLESLNYALQTHLEERNTLKLLQAELKRLRASYGHANASKKHKQKILERAKLFFPDVAESSFYSLDEGNLKPYADKISKDPGLILNLLVYPLRSHISVFNQQISTNALIYPSLFKRVQGMTGTMWNLNTMADFYDKDQVFLSDTIESTLSLLWSKSDPNKELNILDIKGDESLAVKMTALLKGPGGHIRMDPVSIIDQGGLFRGVDEQKVAQELIRSFPYGAYKQVIYYDPTHNLKLYNTDGSVKDYSPTVTDRNVTLAFWDIQHTTGSDLKINESGKAVMVVNKNTILRDLLQSAWRLRSLHRGQSVEFAIPKPDLEYIKNYLSRYYKRNITKFTIGDLFFYTSMRELDQLTDQTYRSVNLNMDHEVVDSILRYVMDKNLSLSGYTGLYALTKGLFEVRFPPFSYSLYGHPINENLTATVLKESREDVLQGEIVANLAGSAVDMSALEKKLDILVKKGLDLLPAKIRSQSRAFDNQIEVETELELEVDVDTEVEQEIEQKVEMHQVRDDLVARGEWAWDKNKFFDGTYFDNPLAVDVLKKDSIDESSTNLPPVTLLKTALSLRNAEIAPHFDPHLYISMNAAPVYRPMHNEAFKPFEFFTSSQKEFNDVLVSLDETGELLHMTVLSREETEILGQWLVEDLGQTVPSVRTKGYLIYSFGGNFYRFDKNVQGHINRDPKFLENLQAKPLFIKLVAQLKYLTGRSLLNANELAAIDVWLQDAGPQQKDLIEHFENYILQAKKKGQSEFQGSDLYTRFVALKKKYTKAKYFDLTNNFVKGDEDARSESKENLASKIRKGDSDSISETEAMLKRLYATYNGSRSYKILIDAVDLHTELVKKGSAIDSAFAELMVLISETDVTLHEKVIELGRQIFIQQAKAEQAMIAYLDLGTSDISHTELAKRMALLAEDFAEDIFSSDEHCKKIIKNYLVDILHKEEKGVPPAVEPSSDVSKFLLKMAGHETGWSVLKIELSDWLSSSDPVQIKRAWWAYKSIISSSVVLKAEDIQAFNDLAKEQILNGDFKQGKMILLAMMDKKYAESLSLGFSLLEQITDSVKKTEWELELSKRISTVFTDDEKSPAKKTKHLVLALESLVKMASTDQSRNRVSDLLVKYANDKRKVFSDNVKRIGKDYFAKPEAAQRFVKDLSDPRHTGGALASLERVAAVLIVYNSSNPGFVELEQKLAAEYLPTIIDQLQYQVTGDSAEAKLFQQVALALLTHINSWQVFKNWQGTHPKRALAWATWLLTNNSDTPPPELLELVSLIVRDSSSLAPEMVGAMRVLELLLKENDPDAIALSRESWMDAVRLSDDPDIHKEYDRLDIALVPRLNITSPPRH